MSKYYRATKKQLLKYAEWNREQDADNKLHFLYYLHEYEGVSTKYDEIDMNGTNLSYADLEGADLADIDFQGVNLYRADLSDANLAGATLDNAKLQEADLSRVNLEEATLINADLSYATLCEAVLANADFTEANLVGADLTRARLTSNNFSNADLTGAIVDYAKLQRHGNLHNSNLDEGYYKYLAEAETAKKAKLERKAEEKAAKQAAKERRAEEKAAKQAAQEAEIIKKAKEAQEIAEAQAAKQAEKIKQAALWIHKLPDEATAKFEAETLARERFPAPTSSEEEEMYRQGCHPNAWEEYEDDRRDYVKSYMKEWKEARELAPLYKGTLPSTKIESISSVLDDRYSDQDNHSSEGSGADYDETSTPTFTILFSPTPTPCVEDYSKEIEDYRTLHVADLLHADLSHPDILSNYKYSEGMTTINVLDIEKQVNHFLEPNFDMVNADVSYPDIIALYLNLIPCY